ncbi:MAG: AtpZ/AtpI family protein [Alphaproteobacteria bacterium]|nr:AtpZ/AtpI family protein [Alphaproteobacteria bacterium]
MTERKAPPSLDDLGARLKAARERQDGAEPAATAAEEAPFSGLGMAARIGVELVASLAVGAGIGWLLDQWLGTAPWLMVVFLFLGMGAGVSNVYRAMNRLGSAVGYRDAGDDSEGPKSGYDGS